MGGHNENERVASPEVVYENSKGFKQSVSVHCSGIKLLQLGYSLRLNFACHGLNTKTFPENW